MGPSFNVVSAMSCSAMCERLGAGPTAIFAMLNSALHPADILWRLCEWSSADE